MSTHADMASEHALIDGLLAGDGSCARVLHESHHRALVERGARRLRDRALAEDVAQQTWVAVLRGIDRFERRSSLRTWIYRIHDNVVVNHLEARRRTVPLSGLATATREDDDPAASFDRLTEGARNAGRWTSAARGEQDDPESRLLVRETLGLVAEALRTMPALHRRVFVACVLDGRSGTEVASALGLTAVYQRVLLHRARCHIRQHVGPALAA